MAKPYDWKGERQAAIDLIAGNERFVPRIYYDSRGIPTTGYGTSLTGVDKKPWRHLDTRLGALGVTDPNVVKQVVEGVGEASNPGGIEAWAPEEKWKNPAPFGVMVKEPAARAVLGVQVDENEPALKQAFGNDAAGNSNWDKLDPKQRNALRDAYYNGPGLIGPGIIGVVKNQDDPAWRDKAWWEMAINVKDPNARRLDEANSFTTNSFLKSPVESTVHDPKFWDDMGRELERGMEAPNSARVPVAQAAPPAGDTTSQLMNALEDELQASGY